MLHLDVKPANVLVTSKGICKLGDFGCSVSMVKSGTPVGSKAFLVGTPGYQAPELLLGKSPAAACDVYSLGILLWQLDSREAPYAGQHPQVSCKTNATCGFFASNVTFSGRHVERGSCRRPPHHSPS